MSAWLFSTPTLLATRTVSAAGEITARVHADTALGMHRLAVTDAAGAVIGWTDIEVVAAGSLAATGGTAASALWPALLAGSLLAAGLVLVVRRRRSAAPPRD